MIPEHLVSIYAEEERIRLRSLSAITTSETLSEHLAVIHDSMDGMFILCIKHPNESDDQLTIQMLGARLFNSSAASLKLALSGYYQTAYSIGRDTLETTNLLDYLRSNPNEIHVWKNSDEKTRSKKFRPVTIRRILDERDGFTSGARNAAYKMFSEYATHATYKGFQLITQNNLGTPGPFFDEKLLKAWLADIAKHLGHTVRVLNEHFPNISVENSASLDIIFSKLLSWQNKYIPSSDR